MAEEEFIEWMESLELQTLTDELKDCIIDNFESVISNLKKNNHLENDHLDSEGRTFRAMEGGTDGG